MTKVGKLVSGLIATQFFYAGYFFLSNGSFIFPLPLNEIIIFIAIVFALYHEKFKIRKIEFILLGLYALIEIINSQFFLRSIFGIEQYQLLDSFFLFDITKIIKVLLLIMIYIYWSRGVTLHQKYLFLFYLILSGVLLFINVFTIVSIVVLFSSILFLIPIFTQKAITNLWVLFLFDLYTTYWMTGTFLV